MKESNQLNFAWLSELTNPHHDGMTQQIDDFAAAFTTDNARYLAMAEALHQARQKEDSGTDDPNTGGDTPGGNGGGDNPGGNSGGGGDNNGGLSDDDD